MKPGWAHLVLIAALYYGGVKLGMLTVMPEGIAMFWPANAVVLAALIRFQEARLWLLAPLVVATEVAASWPAFSLTEAALFGSINFAEAAGAFLLLRRLRFDPGFGSLADAGKFVLAGPLLASLGAALAGAAVYSVFRGGETTYLGFVRTWWFGDSLGLLILTPLILGFAPFRTASPGIATPLPLADALVALLAVLIVAAVWAQRLPAVLVLPLVLYVAARYPPRWAAVAVAGTAALVVAAVLLGRTPFGTVTPREAVLHAQELIFVTALLGLGFSTLLAQLRAQQRLLEQRVGERTRELQAANAELARLATVDPLTGVGNRRMFDEVLAAEVERARRYGGALSLVLADIDHFKDVNDSHGHAAGDEVLRAVAGVLQQAARGVDILARHGGEEFAVILPQTTAAQAVYFAERARHAVAGQVRAPHGKRVTLSFGVAGLGVSGDAAQLLRDADDALYRAKREGRNRVARADRLAA